MGDIMQFIPDQAEGLVSDILNQGKKWDDQFNQVKAKFTTITPGVWEGAGAAAFGEFVITEYIPAAMELIGAIAGFGGGFTSAFDIIKGADQSMFSQASDLIGDFNF